MPDGGGRRARSVDDVRFRVSAARRMLYRAGCDSGIAGHVSARAEGEPAFWITPFEYFDETLPERVLKVSFELDVLEGTWEASPVIGFHARLYEARPDVGAIVHTHSHYVTVLSTTDQFVGMYSPAAVIFAGQQARYADDGLGPSVEGTAMAAALGDRSVLLMKNHGALVASATLESATVEAMALEQCARVHLGAVAAGGSEIAPAEVEQSRKAYDRHFRAMTWEANLRRLRRSDPDLFAALDGGDRSQLVSGAP